MRLLLAGITFLMLTGCAGGNASIGSGLPDVGIETLRKVQLEMQVTDEVPANATIIGKVSASRGHRDARDIEPTNADVTLDLKCAGFAVGGDGIAQVKIQRNSGLMRNFWYVLEGEAVAWREAN